MKRTSTFLPLLCSLLLGANCGSSPPELLPLTPVGRLTAIGDGSYSDSLYGNYCDFLDVSLDGAKTCQRGCAPVDIVEHYCTTTGEFFYDSASGAAARPPLKYAVVDAGGACPRLLKVLAQPVDTAQPVWECSDATQTNIPGFFQQPGRFYLAQDATDYDLPTQVP